MNTPTRKKTLALIILDGWGYREEIEDNAIANANTPCWDKLWAQSPKTLISSSGLDVGLPDGQMGNSEVGHMSLGAGRVVYQNITRIDKAIVDGDFFKNDTYKSAIDKATSANKAVHILGLVSPGGVHSHEKHIHAMIKMAHQRGAGQIYVHAFLDGRDTPPRSAESSLEAISNTLTELNCGRIASVIGRYYAMDRDNRWDRVEKAYRLLTEAKAEFTANSATEALQNAYTRNENDEFVAATTIQKSNEAKVIIDDGDSVIFMNFRADRAREITRAFTDKNFTGFTRNKQPTLGDFVMTTKYASDINANCAFSPSTLSNSFGELMENMGKTQLRIAETEKYAHVTFFFSGGRETPYKGEDRLLIPSPDVATYDLQPEMSAPEVTDKLVEAIKSNTYDVIICNFANGDMVGHTGDYNAALKAAATIDQVLLKVTSAIKETGNDCLITADHGNCEQMVDHESGQAHTQHTTEHVPFLYIGDQQVTMSSQPGKLADVAPTMLTLMGLKQPTEMTGQSLINIKQ